MITVTNSTHVSKLDQYVHPITREAAIEVASNIRDDDRRELEEGHGLNPMFYLKEEAKLGSCIYFEVPNGKTAGMAGVDSDGDYQGMVWMLCTDAINEFPLTFARESKRWIESRPEPLLWNYMDPRNEVHKKLLKFLGFKFLRKVPFGPNQLPFIEFCRVRRSISR